jgi:hypothetical protein
MLLKVSCVNSYIGKKKSDFNEQFIDNTLFTKIKISLKVQMNFKIVIQFFSQFAAP